MMCHMGQQQSAALHPDTATIFLDLFAFSAHLAARTAKPRLSASTEFGRATASKSASSAPHVSAACMTAGAQNAYLTERPQHAQHQARDNIMANGGSGDLVSKKDEEMPI